MKLDLKAFALTCAIVCGGGVFLVTWWLIMFEGQSGDLTLIGRVFRGYNISALGSVIGLVWGLADGLIVGAVFAWLYNKLHGGAPKPAE